MSAPALSAPYRLRRSQERGYEDFGWADNWMTFSFSRYHDPNWIRFGPLRVMVENHIQPHGGFSPHSHRDVEVLTYVVAGTLSHRDSFGHQAQVQAGEMQLISAGSQGMIHAETNDHDSVEHNYQIWLIPNRQPTEFAYHQLGFTAAERQGQLRLYVSPDGQQGSMPVNTDARVYAGLFAAGASLRHQLLPGRGLWIQLVRGQGGVTAPAAIALATGDGLGLMEPGDYRFEFTDASEILLFDLGLETPVIWT